MSIESERKVASSVSSRRSGISAVLFVAVLFVAATQVCARQTIIGCRSETMASILFFLTPR